jgi:hypothetical protein
MSVLQYCTECLSGWDVYYNVNDVMIPMEVMDSATQSEAAPSIGCCLVTGVPSFFWHVMYSMTCP